MAGKRRPKSEAEQQLIERERAAWILREQGWSHQKIAERIGVDRTTISKLLKRVAERLKAASVDELAEMKMSLSQQYQFVISEALAEWAKSKDPKREVNKETFAVMTGPPDANGNPTPVVANETTKTKVVQHTGNPIYLDRALEAMGRLEKLMGLAAPTRSEVDLTSQGEPLKVLAPQIIHTDAVSLPPLADDEESS